MSAENMEKTSDTSFVTIQLKLDIIVDLLSALSEDVAKINKMIKEDQAEVDSEDSFIASDAEGDESDSVEIVEEKKSMDPPPAPRKRKASSVGLLSPTTSRKLKFND